MLDTVKKQHQPKRLYQVPSAVPRLIPKELFKLVRSITKLHAIPNPVQRYWASLLPSSFVQDLVLRTTLY